jgi:hypothetical protein
MRRTGLLLAMIALALAWRISRRSEPVPAPEARNSPLSTTLSTTAAAPMRTHPTASRPGKEEWKRFQEKFGAELQSGFSADGRLVSISGRPGAGKRAQPGFTPEDPRQAIARAKEIVEQARALLGINEDWPLGEPLAQTGKISAQVYFQQSRGGVPVAPFGTVSVDLDSQGGLIRLDSSYAPDPQIVNDPVLDSSEAKLRALGAVGDQSSTLKPQGGNTVLWISAGGSEARYAYEYYIQGRRVIVDAGSGAILLKRDVRQN